MVAAVKDPADAAATCSKDMPLAVSAEQDSCPAVHDNWSRASKAIMPSVAVSRALKTLRDMCGPEAVLDPKRLTKITTLGAGGFASVDLALYQPPGSASQVKVAVKRLKPELFATDDLQLFAQEVALMRKLSHRNIVDMVGVVDGCSYTFVQEYMSGGNLKQLVTKQMLSNGGRVYSLTEGLDICLQMAQGLKYLHSCRPMVIHRDLKLENVLFNVLHSNKAADGCRFQVKLADFGLSKCVEVKQQALAVRRATSDNSSHPSQLRSCHSDKDAMWSKKAQQNAVFGHRTKSNPLLQRPAKDQTFNLTGKTGSLLYMAPEVFKEQPYSEKADVFSFGVMMYEVMHRYIMLSAVAVRGTYEELEEYAARVASSYRPPLHGNLPDSITSIIEDCWADNPMSRPSMDAVVSRLEAAVAAEDLEGLDKPGCSCTIC